MPPAVSVLAPRAMLPASASVPLVDCTRLAPASAMLPVSVLLPAKFSMAPLPEVPAPLIVTALARLMPPCSWRLPPELTLTAPLPSTVLEPLALSVPLVTFTAPLKPLPVPERYTLPVPATFRLLAAVPVRLPA